MSFTCLLVDLADGGHAALWQAATEGARLGLDVSYVAGRDEAIAQVARGETLVMGIFARGTSDPAESATVLDVMRSFQTNTGCIADFQVVICDDPDPRFMAAVFEFGVEQFLSEKEWGEGVGVITRRALRLMEDTNSAEAKTIALSRSIRSADQSAIKTAEAAIGELAEYDYRAAYARGKAFEATGDYTKAADAFFNAAGMNKMFRPSASSLGETLLVTGRVDEALAVFQKLERTNPYDVERKANMAAAYVERGEFDKAMEYVEAAAKLAPGSSKVLEARAQVLLCTGKVGDAFKLLDDMSEVGPFFAAKLNELGIQLSQQGKGKSALALYQKAHKIVRPELRYKISMNAALACRRLAAWDMALKFLSRCEKEYGANFPKLQKIRDSVTASKAQQPAPAAPKIEKAG